MSAVAASASAYVANSLAAYVGIPDLRDLDHQRNTKPKEDLDEASNAYRTPAREDCREDRGSRPAAGGGIPSRTRCGRALGV
jgi:hypothetical protein